jgi:formamidopyrimidine-DNA glycosylase
VPEGLEAEIWRTAIAETEGRRIVDAWVDERVAAPDFVRAVVGTRITTVRRVGKVVVIDTSGPSIGLHFGMTGRIVVDGRSAINQLEYGSSRSEASWDRLMLWTDRRRARVPAVRMNDPRRFGRVSLDPPLDHLGVDIFAVTRARLAPQLARRRTSVKAVLLDQTAVAGLGNLCVDEVLWWAGIDPRRAADGLTTDEVGTLASAIRRRMPIMLRRGGSSTGTIDPATRRMLGPCPRDGGELLRGVVGGRTTVWCGRHQC